MCARAGENALEHLELLPINTGMRIRCALGDEDLQNNKEIKTESKKTNKKKTTHLVVPKPIQLLTRD